MKYTICKGNHYSLPPLPILASGSVDEYDIWLSKEWNHNQEYDYTNKLVGRSNTFDRRITSLRIGCICSENQIKLVAYEHINGVRKVEPLTIVHTESWIRVKFKYNNLATYIFINGRLIYKSTFISNKIAYFCKPYYGGKPTCKEDLQVKIVKL